MAVLMRSVGVTAKMLATMPELIPANMLRSGERAPVSGSLKAFLIMSKERKRTPSLAIEPTIRDEQPLYNALGPSLRKTSETTMKGFRGLEAFPSLRSWTRVFANSNGYVRAASTPPAIPPETSETRGWVLALDSSAAPDLELIRS